jgi:hypothetical protein
MLASRESVRALLTSTGNEHWDLDVATDQPLYALLRHVDAHVTHSSSAVVEAAEFGVPSVLFSEVGAELFPGPIAAGWAAVSVDGDLLEVVRAQAARRSRRELPAPPPRQLRNGVDEVLGMIRERRSGRPG